jgi:hypothetical protein
VLVTAAVELCSTAERLPVSWGLARRGVALALIDRPARKPTAVTVRPVTASKT